MVTALFYVDTLSYIMLALIGGVGSVVWLFARRYLVGDCRRKWALVELVVLVGAVGVMVIADHIFLLWCSLVVTDLLLCRLMLHKVQWYAARVSALFSLQQFFVKQLFYGGAFFFLWYETGSLSVQQIVHAPINNGQFFVSGLLCLLMAIVIQSGLWPYYRWLISSLNSPTPVSAIMHAGVVNGGGFLLTRFAPLYSRFSSIMALIFCVGLITAIIGTIIKLVQTDIKRMLACSTMSQMGFMAVQCGIGLFPAAVAHMCWHGCFKALLFLSSGRVVENRRFDREGVAPWLVIIIGVVAGVLGALSFSFICGIGLFCWNASLIIQVVAFVATMQSAITLCETVPFAYYFSIPVISALLGLWYGMQVMLIELLLPAFSFIQPMHIIHGIGVVILLVSCPLLLLYLRYSASSLGMRLYVAAVNYGQPVLGSMAIHATSYNNGSREAGQ